MFLNFFEPPDVCNFFVPFAAFEIDEIALTLHTLPPFYILPSLH